MDKISVYTILYYDLQFYEDIITQIYDYVDEFIIIDGPYSYAIDTLKQFNLFYDETNKPLKLNDLMTKYSKIKYKYVICETEEEKRITGYNMCSNNLVLLVDTDEFLEIDASKLQNFINNANKYVCCSKIYNMCDYNVATNNLTEKYSLFKKQKITALEHLNYTWLVGCKQGNKNISYMDFNNFGMMHHFTLNRNKENNIVKFIFYVLLYKKNNNKHLNLFDNITNADLLKHLTSTEILNIFVHSHKNRINIPTDLSCLKIITDASIINLQKYNNSLDFEFKTEMKCLLNVPVNLRLPKTKEHYILLLENASNVTIIINYIYLNNVNNRSYTYKYSNEHTDCIKIDTLHNNAMYVYIELNCTTSIDNNIIYTIKNVY